MFKIILLFLFPIAAVAMKPCPPVNKNTEWIAEVELVAATRKLEPYPNCYLEDKAKCAMRDLGDKKFKVLKWIKGNRKEKQISLTSALCAPAITLQLGIKYRIFGNQTESFDHIELLEQKQL